MITDTEAIVFRQIKTLNGRRMILLFSKKFGKISVGTGITEGGKNKSALALRPFTYGRYELFKGRESYNLNNGQVVKSHYSLGEDLDKYMAGSYVLELTEKLLAEDLPQPKMFNLLSDFLDALENTEKRRKNIDTLTMAYMVKALDILGTMPNLTECSVCGKANPKRFFGVAEGGMICPDCAGDIINRQINGQRNTQIRQINTKEQGNEPLIYDTNFDIVNILNYFRKESLGTFEKLTLDEEILKELKAIIKSYMAYHLDVGKLKSEDFSFE